MFVKKEVGLERLIEVAKELIESYSDDRIFAFYGQMGAGKTTFIQAICRVLGSNDNINSPSFSIINEYSTFLGESIYHFDFYRIKNLEEAFDLGYEDYFYSDKVCLIEWPEKIEPLLPRKYVKVTLEVSESGTRQIQAKLMDLSL